MRDVVEKVISCSLTQPEVWACISARFTGIFNEPVFGELQNYGESGLILAGLSR